MEPIITLRQEKAYLPHVNRFNDIDLTNSFPAYFVIKKNTIIIAHSDIVTHTWLALLKAIWNSMELKRIILNTTFDLIQKEIACENDERYHRGDIVLPFTMKNNNDTFKREIINLININEYTIDITILWEDGERIIHYKNII